VVATVGRRIFGLLTDITRMSECPQLGRSAPNAADECLRVLLS
jgi:hypothetical protein